MSKEKYSIGIGFSSNCNMNCPFCYSKSKRKNEEKVMLSQWFDFFDRNYKVVKDINYGTGENTTSKEWYALINYIRGKYPHIKQALTTNGSLYKYVTEDSKKLDIVLRCIDEVDVSLDYGDPKKHNYNRGNPNAYNWVLGTLKFCKDNNIPSTIVILGIDDTLKIENLKQIFEIAKEYNAKIRINLYRPVVKSENFNPPTFENIIKAIDWISENHKITCLSDPLFSSIFSDNYTRYDPSGVSSIRITQDGNIYPSTYLLFDNFIMGNIRDYDLLANANKQKNKNFDTEYIPNICKKCENLNRCKGGTLDRRYLWYSSFEEQDPYCPKRYNKPVRYRNYKIYDDGFESVHDGYLPTMFFKY